jgi:hypothetical protein
MQKTVFLFLAISLLRCQSQPMEPIANANLSSISNVNKVPLPSGFERVKSDTLSFGYYLQNLSFAKNNTIYLYNGIAKQNQRQHYRVIELELPKKDIQQCADAIMRLRANYFFNKKQYRSIQFKSSSTTYNFFSWLAQHDAPNLDTTKVYNKFLEKVFINCGTYNLAEMLKPKQNVNTIQVGDVFVKAGSPGHAMIVVDVAYNNKTKQIIFMLAQSFMPAQNLHVVINENDKSKSPWYVLDSSENLITPEYNFSYSHLKEW